MSTIVSVSGSSYSVPAEGDSGWANDVTNLLIQLATSTKVLQVTSNSFPLVQDLSFGTSFGVKLQYLKSQATNPASAGVLRLGNTESVMWRNAANNADLNLTVNASNALQYNGSSILSAGAASIVNADVSASAAIAYSKLNLSNSILNADVNASAAIAYSKLNLATSILNADVSASAAIAYSKLNLSGSILNADVGVSAAIAYSKLALSNSILNADINASAAIARTKLAALTVSRAMVTDASGFESASAVTAVELGYVSGVTSAIQTQITNKQDASTAVTLTGVQVITNKDIDGGTASNTSRITLPKAAKTTLDALTRKAGTILFDTTSNKPYYDDGANLQLVGSGSGGAKNYVTGGDAEAGTAGFNTYNDLAGTSPVDGTGGTPVVTFTTSSTAPLSGSSSFLLTKGATNRQGDGFSYAFTIDAQDKAKVLQISANYLVSSGTFVAGTSTTASDVSVWIYDVTNAVIIQPSSYSFLSNSTTLADKFNATFQTSSNSTSYRLIFHVGSTSALAYTLQFDSIAVSPSTYVYGTPVTDWQTYTPSGSWVTNTTYSGQWRRVGKNLEFRIHMAIAGAPTATPLTLTYLPSGLSVDTSALLTSATDGTVTLATGTTKSAGATYDMSAYYNGTTSIAPVVKSASGTYTSGGTNITNLVPATYAAADTIQFYGSVPILGWSASVQMSDQTDTRVVAARVSKLTSQTGVAPNNTFVKLLVDTVVDGDTHGMLNVANNRLVAIVPGWYDVTAYAYFGGTNVLANLYIGGIYKNGALHSQGATTVATLGTSFGVGTSAKVYLNVNDYVEAFIYGQGNNSASTLTATIINLAISKISGPNAIAATESVNCRYTTATGTAIGTSYAVIPYGTKDYDSHGSYNTSTGLYTALISGKFRISAKLLSASVTLSTAQNLEIAVFKNGSLFSALANVKGNGVANSYLVGGDDTISLIAGDTFGVYALSSVATTVNTGGANYNHLEIQRVDN